MDKRLTKRHKRQVARARERVNLSEPDVRTPEQIKAAREASRPTGGFGHESSVQGATQAVRGGHSPSPSSAAKTDA